MEAALCNVIDDYLAGPQALSRSVRRGEEEGDGALSAVKRLASSRPQGRWIGRAQHEIRVRCHPRRGSGEGRQSTFSACGHDLRQRNKQGSSDSRVRERAESHVSRCKASMMPLLCSGSEGARQAILPSQCDRGPPNREEALYSFKSRRAFQWQGRTAARASSG